MDLGFGDKAIQSELIEDKRDLAANHPVASEHGFSIEAQHFDAWYLLSHGVAKPALVTCLLTRKPWAHPTTMVVLGCKLRYDTMSRR